MTQLELSLPSSYVFRYVMDTSVLIDFDKNFHRQVFKNLWQKLEEAAQKNEVIFVEATWEELDRYSTHVADWVKGFYLHQPSPEEQLFVAQLQVDYPDLVDWNATREYADPYILACARQFNLAIVTHEKHNRHKSKIPTVAKDFGIKCLSLNGFFLEMGWQF